MSAAPIQWLHLTDEDLSRARRVIAAFKEDDTVDVLGFQPISERFDDWFYPAVTTPMTRAKYYIAVPAIYAYLERQQLGYQRFLERASAMQHELQRILLRAIPTVAASLAERRAQSNQSTYPRRSGGVPSSGGKSVTSSVSQ
jgi:hypothetical protein